MCKEEEKENSEAILERVKESPLNKLLNKEEEKKKEEEITK